MSNKLLLTCGATLLALTGIKSAFAYNGNPTSNITFKPYIGLEAQYLNYDMEIDDSGLRYGLGAQYHINDNASVRLLGRYQDISDLPETISASLGVTYSF